MLTPSPPVSSVEMSAAGPPGRSTTVVVVVVVGLLTSAATSGSPRSLVPEPSSEHAASSTTALTAARKPHDLRRPRTAGCLPGPARAPAIATDPLRHGQAPEGGLPHSDESRVGKRWA